MTIILLFLAFSLQSYAGRFDGEPPIIHRQCDHARLAECRNREQIALQECQSRANGFLAQENIVNTDLSTRREILAAIAVAGATTGAQARRVRAELQFLDDITEKPSRESDFFPGSPTVQNFFSMDSLSMNWEEKYPEQYRLKLKDQESNLATSSQKISQRRSEIENEINLMLPTLAFFSGEKNRWLNDVGIHAHMWEKGCRNQVCPDNF